MILLIILLALFWSVVFVFVLSQVIMPMFTNYKFFWIFTYFKLRRKYKQEINEVSKQEMEQELKNSIFKQFNKDGSHE